MATHALVEIGERSKELREPAAAAMAFREAAARFGALGLTADRALTLNLQGEALNDEGNYRAACEVWKQAMPVASTLTPSDRAWLLTNYGWVLKEEGDRVAALGALQEAMTGFGALGMHGEELYARLGIADLHLMQRNLPVALAELSRGATLSREYARPDQEARFLQRLGILYSEAGDDEAAREHWQRALSLHHAAGNPTGEAAVLMQLGDLAAELETPRRPSGAIARPPRCSWASDRSRARPELCAAWGTCSPSAATTPRRSSCTSVP